MKKIIFAFIIIFSGFINLPAHACTWVHKTIEENFISASYVFNGRVIEAKEEKVNSHLYAAIKFEILENYKGNSDSIDYYRTTLEINCGISVTIGQYYYIFADKNGYTSKVHGSKATYTDRNLESKLQKLAK